MMIRRLFCLLCWFWISSVHSAQELEIQEFYAPQTALKVSNLGVSFQLPEDWGGKLDESFNIMTLASNSHAGMIILLSKTNATMSSLFNELTQQQKLSEHLVMEPITLPQRKKPFVIASYSAEQNGRTAAGEAGAVLNPETGLAVVILAMGPNDQRHYFKQLVAQFLSQVTFFTPEDKTSQENTPETELIEIGEINQVRGKKLVAEEQVGFMYRKREITLCEDHRFYYYHSMGARANNTKMGMKGVFEKQDTGYWTLNQDYQLLLRWSTGEISAMSIDGASSLIYLNGHPWKLYEQGSCEPKDLTVQDLPLPSAEHSSSDNPTENAAMFPGLLP